MAEIKTREKKLENTKPLKAKHIQIKMRKQMKLRWMQTRKTAQRNLKDMARITGSDDHGDYAGSESYAENTVKPYSKLQIKARVS